MFVALFIRNKPYLFSSKLKKIYVDEHVNGKNPFHCNLCTTPKLLIKNITTKVNRNKKYNNKS